MKDTTLVFFGVAALLVLYFVSSKNAQATTQNLSGLNNSFPTFNLLYPISADQYFPTASYSGFAGGMPMMYEAPSNPTYYYSGTNTTPMPYTNQSSVFSLLGPMFGG